MSLDPATSFTHAPGAMAKTVGDETVILDLDHGIYFGLDPVGTRIWQLIGDGRTIGETCDELYRLYDVDRQRLDKETGELLAELVERKLIVRKP